MRVIRQYHVRLVLQSPIFPPYFKVKAFMVVAPFSNLPDRVLPNHIAFLHQVNTLRFHEKFEGVISGNGERQGQRALRTDLKKLILYGQFIKMIVLQPGQIVQNILLKRLLVMQLIHPQRKAPLNIVICLVR